MNRNRLVALMSAAVLGASGLGAGLALSLGRGPGALGQALKPAGPNASYAYYLSLAQHFSGEPGSSYRPMMGGSGYGPMMGGGYPWASRSGYGWMMGGSGAPGWMIGGSLPGSVTRGNDNMGEVMGKLFANAPGPRVSPAEAAKLGDEAPRGATVDRSTNTVTFSGHKADLAVLASPSMPAENFKLAGLTDPAIVVPEGAQVQVELVNADDDMAHGFVVSARGAGNSWMPMMSAPPAFSGSALWFLGEKTSAGMHVGTLTFSASTPGTYTYLCPVPGHAQEGMEGSFVVKGAPAS
ncbi:MAG: sulfocyanin-like copper-binding protein [Actinomycetota bacterium]|nr:sulfocyanin-like copper-binding protein [Actinomycetota bacterium]